MRRSSTLPSERSLSTRPAATSRPNRTACRLAGYTREELLAAHETLAAEPEEVTAKLEEMTMGDLANGTTRMRCQDGTCVPSSIASVRHEAEGCPHFVLVFWELHADE